MEKVQLRLGSIGRLSNLYQETTTVAPLEKLRQGIRNLPHLGTEPEADFSQGLLGGLVLHPQAERLPQP